MLLRADLGEAQTLLRTAIVTDLGDWFHFEVGDSSKDPDTLAGGGLRFPVRALLDGRPFEGFHADVGSGDPVVGSLERLTPPPLLAFAEIQPAAMPCYPIPQQIAEKVHALTRPHPAGESTRAKDLADILLMAAMGAIHGQTLLSALRATFEARHTHPIPTQLPEPPAAWTAPVRRLAEDLDLEWKTLAHMTRAARLFLDPVLEGRASGTWDPSLWRWA